MTADRPDYPNGLNRSLMLASLGLTFLVFGLPIYAKELGASALEIGGLFSVFTLTTLLLRPLIGWALDRYGRKTFLVLGLAGYAVTMALFGWADGLPGLYLARFANGAASALTWIAATTMVADLAAAGDRGRALGLVTEMGARGEVFGAFAGFFLLNSLSPEYGWTAVFTVYALAAAAGAWLGMRTVPETRSAAVPTHVTRPRLRIAGSFAWLLAIVFTTALTQSMTLPIYMIYLQDRFTTDVGTLALAFFPAGIVYSFLPSRLGRLGDRFNGGRLGRAPFLAAGLLGAGLLFLFLPRLPGLSWLIVLYTLSAAGWALSIPAETALVADITGRETRGLGFGLYQSMSSLGAVFGPLLGGWLYDQISPAVPFYLSGAILLLSAAVVMLTLRVHPMDLPPEPLPKAG